MTETYALSPDLLKLLARHGMKPDRDLDASFDDEDSAIDFLKVLLEPGEADDWTTAEWAEDLCTWQMTTAARHRSSLKRVVSGAVVGQVTVRAKHELLARAHTTSPLATSLETELLSTHWRSRLVRRMQSVSDVGERRSLEDKERSRWIEALGEIFIRGDLPSARVASKSANPSKALQGAAGTLRYRTLRTRVRTWWKVREWIFCTTGRWHTSSTACLIDYLLDVASEDCAPSRIQGIAAALSVVEKRGGVPPLEMICENVLWKQTVNQLTMDSQKSRGMGIKKAPGYTVKMLISLELFVVGNSGSFFRLVAFCKLLKLWGCLRFNDLQGINPGKVVFSREGIRLVMERSKTTGPGKRTGDMMVFISRTAGFSGADWQSTGMSLLKSESLYYHRDYLVPMMGGTDSEVRHRMADYAAMSGYSKAVLRLLKDVGKTNVLWSEGTALLIHEALVNHWSEHSERHFLPQALAVFQVEKNLRDRIGRWGVNSMHQSDDYILNQRKIIHSLQRRVSQELSYRTQQYDEEFMVEGMIACLTLKGLDPSEAAAAADRVKTPGYNPPFFGLSQAWPLGPWAAHLSEDRIDEAATVALGDVEQTVEAPVADPEPGKWWCSVSERGHRRLHKIGTKLCCAKPQSCRNWEFVESVKDAKINSMCKFCWGSASAQSSSSGSSSTGVASADDSDR